MPQSKPPRKNQQASNPIKKILEQARSIDRRRQAQIENQVQSINRLLKSGEYSEEMRILHMATAQYKVENEDLTAALRQLVDKIDGLPLDGLRLGRGAHVTAFAEALAAARALITPAGDPVIKTELIPGTPYHGPIPSASVSDAEGEAG